MQQNPPPQPPQLSADDIEVRVWGFVVITVTLILCVIVIALLYSVTFVTQPIKAMAPIDQAYTKMLNDIKSKGIPYLDQLAPFIVNQILLYY